VSDTLALDVRGLNLVLDPHGRRLHVVRDVDIALRQSEVLGLIGESGSGKTMTGMALLRLEPNRAQITAATMRVGGNDLLATGERGLRALRGRTVGMIFQDPVGAFNPAKRIGWHARHALRQGSAANSAWRTRALEMLAEVDITDGARVLAAYPHQLSGGMLQRVLIALTLAPGPQVVVADEPTTNLDNIVEQQILRLFRRLKRQQGAAFVFITHDMSVAATLCDRIAVMYAGEIVETGDAAGIFAMPRHPYTQALVATARALQSESGRLPEIAGEMPGPAAARLGCAFAPRCPRHMAACDAGPIPTYALPGQVGVRCLLYAAH
jgi:peptide/nickel transport system ATP-binding protein